MKINEVILEADFDRWRNNAPPSEGAVKNRFISIFTDKVKTAYKTSKKSGMPFNARKFIDSYMRQYGWIADPEEVGVLNNLADATTLELNNNSWFNPNLKKLANAMYTVGVQSKGRQVTPTPKTEPEPLPKRVEPTLEPTTPASPTKSSPTPTKTPDYSPRW